MESESIIRIPQEKERKYSVFNRTILILVVLCFIVMSVQFGFFSSGKSQHIEKNNIVKDRQTKQAEQNKNDTTKSTTVKQPNTTQDRKKNPDQNEQSQQSKGDKTASNTDRKGQDQNVENKEEIKSKSNESDIKAKEVEEDIVDDVENQKKGNIRGSQKEQKDKSTPMYLSNTVVDEETILWGHYKSHLVYNLSQKKNNPLTMSMSYNPDMNFNKIYTKYEQKSGVEEIHYDFKYNDGTRFSEFLIDDKRYDFKVESTFIKQIAKKGTQKWVNQHRILKTNPDLSPSRKQRSLIYSFSKEVYDQASLNVLNEEGKYFHFIYTLKNKTIVIEVYGLPQNKRQSLEITSEYKFLGSFVLAIQKENVTLFGAELEGIITTSSLFFPQADKMWDISKAINENLNQQTKTLNNVKGSDNDIANFLLLQITFDQSFDYTVSISFNSSKKSNEQLSPIKYPFAQSLSKLVEQYENQVSMSIESKGISDNHSCTVFALSNLLGGMTYKFGELEYSQSEERARSTPKAIFSFTPSRTRFGWSFLWDDGFHNAVASKFQPKLTSYVIKSWLDSQNDQGWICREQSRGEEAAGLCHCPGFAQKDNRDGNPPTLILAIEYFLRDHFDIVEDLINEGYYQKIEKWYHWYLKTQMVRDQTYAGNTNDFTDFEKNSFVFKYWDQAGQVQSMNSGLDDYPRNDNAHRYSEPIGHIDLQSWMYHFTHIMEDLSVFNLDTAKIEYYQKIKLAIRERTEEYFLDEEDSLYKDILSDNRNLRSITYSPHFGYPNLLPLAFGLVQDDGYQLKTILQRIQDPNKLWTPYGLRSLSASDSFFKKGNNYWTNPIWIQMNYLVLRGLKLYYNTNEKATEVYTKLRQNVSGVVCSNWEKRGYFYENYNKNDDGNGSDAHPFTGWTATVALINAENY